MQTILDQAITNAAAAEATFTADNDNVTSILGNIESTKITAQTAIEAATAPLADAKSKLNQDSVTYKQALLDLAKAATDTAAQIPDQDAPAQQ